MPKKSQQSYLSNANGCFRDYRLRASTKPLIISLVTFPVKNSWTSNWKSAWRAYGEFRVIKEASPVEWPDDARIDPVNKANGLRDKGNSAAPIDPEKIIRKDYRNWERINRPGAASYASVISHVNKISLNTSGWSIASIYDMSEAGIRELAQQPGFNPNYKSFLNTGLVPYVEAVRNKVWGNPIKLTTGDHR